MEPYYDEGGITIYHGDCLEVLPELDHFDVAFADPPYNCGLDYGPLHDDQMDSTQYWFWCSVWFNLLRAHADRIVITPGHGNLQPWMDRKPTGVAAWYKPGNPAKAGIFQFCEWEPVLVWTKKPIGGSDVWRATVSKQADTGPHPCPKPLALLRKVLMAVRGETVVDPFMGSGTTLRAAKDLGLAAVGIEQNEAYCEIAAKRLGQEVLAI